MVLDITIQKARNKVKNKIDEQRATYKQICEIINASGSKQTPQNIANKLTKGTLKLTEYIEILDALEVLKNNKK